MQSKQKKCFYHLSFHHVKPEYEYSCSQDHEPSCWYRREKSDDSDNEKDHSYEESHPKWEHHHPFMPWMHTNAIKKILEDLSIGMFILDRHLRIIIEKIGENQLEYTLENEYLSHHILLCLFPIGEKRWEISRNVWDHIRIWSPHNTRDITVKNMIDEVYLPFWDLSIFVSQILDFSDIYLDPWDIVSGEWDDKVDHLLCDRKISKVRRCEYEDTIGSDILHPVWMDKVISVNTEWNIWIEMDRVTLREWSRDLIRSKLLEMRRYISIPDILIRSIEKRPFLTRPCVLIDIFLIGDIFLRTRGSSIPLPTESIRGDITIEEMTIEPLRGCTPMRMRHICHRSSNIHTEVIMHIACLFENMDPLIESLYSRVFFEKCSRHIMRHHTFLIESNISHEFLSSERFPYSEKVLTPGEFLQKLLDLIGLEPSRENTGPYLTYINKSSRDIRREVCDSTIDMISRFSISDRVDRIDTRLDTRSIRWKWWSWDFVGHRIIVIARKRWIRVKRGEKSPWGAKQSRIIIKVWVFWGRVLPQRDSPQISSPIQRWWFRFLHLSSG